MLPSDGNYDDDLDMIDRKDNSSGLQNRNLFGQSPPKINGFDQFLQNPNESRVEQLNIDESDGSDEDLDQYEVNMEHSGRKKQYKRIYDSKYKFPIEKKHEAGAHRTMNMMEAQILKRKQDHMISFKKCSNTLTTTLMGVQAILMILLYIYLFIKLQEKPYYITRARVQINETVDFERVQVNKLMYFLFRNESKGATDADQAGNQLIVSNMTEQCGDENAYALFSDL